MRKGRFSLAACRAAPAKRDGVLAAKGRPLVRDRHPAGAVLPVPERRTSPPVERRDPSVAGLRSLVEPARFAAHDPGVSGRVPDGMKRGRSWRASCRRPPLRKRPRESGVRARPGFLLQRGCLRSGGVLGRRRSSGLRRFSLDGLPDPS